MTTLDLPDPPFASETEDTIRQRMLDAVASSFNKDAGDFIYDMLTPAAIELAVAYASAAVFLGECFVQTATSTYLDDLAMQLAGLTRITDETDADFRARVIIRLGTPPGAGNEADWRTWALEQEDVAVGFATADYNAGTDTVTVYVADPDREEVNGGDLTTLEAYLETKAPVTLTAVTTDSITSVPVVIAATVSLSPGFALGTALTAAATLKISDYIDTLGPGNDVLYNEIITALMETEGIRNITALTINTAANTLAIAATDISNLSTVTLS